MLKMYCLAWAGVHGSLRQAQGVPPIIPVHLLKMLHSSLVDPLRNLTQCLRTYVNFMQSRKPSSPHVRLPAHLPATLLASQPDACRGCLFG